jgi:putative membrane protein
MMATGAVLPHLTAGLNALALAFLLAGFALLKAGRHDLHRRAMLAAIAVSTLFLIAYGVHHVSAPIFRFRGEEWMRPFYYTLLVSHVVLAAVVTPMVAITAWRALSGRFDRHRRLARWTLPVWLYVSASGIAVYTLLYHVTA